MFTDTRNTANPFTDTRNNSTLIIWEGMPLEKRIRKCVSDISSSDLFADYGPLVMIGEQHIEEGDMTAATDGYNVHYGRKFCMEQHEKGLRFVVIHESRHKGGRDLITYRSLFDKDAELANKAVDYANNAEILARDPDRKFIDLPVGIQICFDAVRFPAGMSPYAIFRELQDDKEAGKSDSDQALDDHKWDDATKGTPQEQQTKQKELDRAVEQGATAKDRMDEASGKGKGKGGADRINRFAETIVPWGDVIHAELTRIASGNDSTTYGQANRRHVSNRRTLLPANISEHIGRVLIACDTSGSVTDDQHALHIGGSAQILDSVRPDGVDVLYWGTSVEAFESYDADQIEDFRHSTKPVGYGGTDAHVVKQWLENEATEDYAAIIVFTDGDIGRGWQITDWGAPIYWAVSSARNFDKTPAEGMIVPVTE